MTEENKSIECSIKTFLMLSYFCLHRTFKFWFYILNPCTLTVLAFMPCIKYFKWDIENHPVHFWMQLMFFKRHWLTCVMPTRKSPFTELVPFSMSPLTRRKPAPRRRKPLDNSSVTSSKRLYFKLDRGAAAGETGMQKNNNNKSTAKVCVCVWGGPISNNDKIKLN